MDRQGVEHFKVEMKEFWWRGKGVREETGVCTGFEVFLKVFECFWDDFTPRVLFWE